MDHCSYKLSHHQVHPHVRGDDVPEIVIVVAVAGPPPRAWGRYRGDRALDVRLGSTPTCVGTIRRRLHTGSSPWVHPHVRGDDHGQLRRPEEQLGPPPRAWGRCLLSTRNVPVDGSTPTCVGTMSSRVTISVVTGVHPHVRGDDLPPIATVRFRQGPPPRAWGRLRRRPRRPARRGSTPTCVGTMSSP